MATVVAAFTLMLAVQVQGGSLPAGPMPDGLSEIERSSLTAAQNIEKRIKIYTEVSGGRRRSVEKAAAESNFDAIEPALRAWTEILSYSLSDIQANAGQRSKSRALKNYEIHLRKAIGAINGIKTKGSYEQLEHFEEWLKHAGEVQLKIVAILFPG